MPENGIFFLTETLKQKKDQKPITSYIPEDGRDPNPLWDELARSIWPATRERQSHRESLADVLMWAIHDDTVLGAAPLAGIAMSRLAQRLMGDHWMKCWLRDNYRPLRRRLAVNKRNYGGARAMLKGFFSSV